MGAGLGMFLLRFFSAEKTDEAGLTKKELPWVIAMILLDVLAPFLLMLGLMRTTAANASLLFNFEMVATSLIASIFFRETVGKHMWISIGIITLASMLLSIDISDLSAWEFSVGSLLVMAACVCWGLENNCTRNLSEKSPAQIVIVKGLGAGTAAFSIAYCTGDHQTGSISNIILALLLGFIAYGLSIFFYVKAQRYLGAARTSAYYAAAPFIGVLLSIIILKEFPAWNFFIASAIMIPGVWLAMTEKHTHLHIHEELTHNHAHLHDDLHHTHVHNPPVSGWHTHEHTHCGCRHTHSHMPDIHHRHQHCG